MIYHLLLFYKNKLPNFLLEILNNLIIRIGITFITSLLIAIICGNFFIKYANKYFFISKKQILKINNFNNKKYIPIMGGIVIIISLIITLIMFAKLDNIYIILMIFTTLSFGIIGFIDDYLKIKHNGLSVRSKIIFQLIISIIIGLVIYYNNNILIREFSNLSQHYKIYNDIILEETNVIYKDLKYIATNIPFCSKNTFYYNYINILLGFDEQNNMITFIIFIIINVFIIISTVNGANLTDGIDGMLINITIIICFTLGIITYMSEDIIISKYFNIFYIPHIRELLIYLSALIGSCIGFLWYNTYPATVFMGDTGSMALGGIIAVFAIIIKKELLIPILCGIFLIENISVILQVSYFKYTKNKYGKGLKVFKMSPLHHHYQINGMHESKINVRFIIVSIVLCVITMLMLNIILT